MEKVIVIDRYRRGEGGDEAKEKLSPQRHTVNRLVVSRSLPSRRSFVPLPDLILCGNVTDVSEIQILPNLRDARIVGSSSLS
jgi:hypothetical protein